MTVTGGRVDEIVEVEVASLNPADVPETIDDYYDVIHDVEARPESFNLVYAYPRWTLAPVGTT